MMTKSRSQTSYYNRMTGALVYPYDWQLKLKKGSYFRIVSEHIPTIYCEVIEPLREIGYYRVMAYSEQCLGGEKGIFPIVVPTRILTKQEFEEAKAWCWKTVEGEVQ